MLLWQDSRPKDNFDDPDCEKFISLLSPLTAFGMILSQRDSALTMYLGTVPEESHHITDMSDITSVPCMAPDMPEFVTPFRLKKDYIHPLCIAPELCKIYGQSRSLSDFTFGMMCARLDPKTVRKRSNRFLDKISKRDTTHIEMTKPVEWKREQNVFFASSVFFSYSKKDIPSFLSSVNFTNPMSEPNGLVASKGKTKSESALQPPRLSWLGGAKTPILSVVELASVMSFPPSMFGLEMLSGADKTFSNYHSDIANPADFFSDFQDK